MSELLGPKGRWSCFGTTLLLAVLLAVACSRAHGANGARRVPAMKSALPKRAGAAGTIPRPVLMPMVAAAAQPTGAGMVAVGAACGRWTIERDMKHPDWPQHYQYRPIECALVIDGFAPVQSPPVGRITPGVAVQSGTKIRLHMVSGGAETQLLVTALDTGYAGEVIRFRSTLGPAILLGRLNAEGSAELVWKLPVESRTGEPILLRGAW